MKDVLLFAMREYFGDDAKRIKHAEEVLNYAEIIHQQEGGDAAVIIPAAILHDIGIHECERKYNSTNGQLQEKEGPPIARDIMMRHGVELEIIDEVCAIIGSHHSPGEIHTLNFHIVSDADWLVNLPDVCDLLDKERVKRTISKVFLTHAGRKIAENIYIGNGRKLV